MSKTALKKELAGFTKDQLIELVLDLYAARKEVKEYFNFFLNPDSEKLFEKYRKAVEKEFNRSKWGRSKARISVIKKLLKEFETFQPDIRYRYSLYLQIIYFGLYYSSMDYFPDSLTNGIYKIVTDYLAFANSNEQFGEALQNLEVITSHDSIGTRSMKAGIKQSVHEYLQSRSALK